MTRSGWGKVKRAMVAALVGVFTAAAFATPAYAASRANMAWHLRALAITQQNNSLRYLHTTWFVAEKYAYAATSTASLESSVALSLPATMEVLDPPYGYSPTAVTMPRGIGLAIASQDASGSGDASGSTEPTGSTIPTGEPIPGTTRGQASAAYATALALANNTFDPKQVGVSKAEALHRTVAWITGCAVSHDAGVWGESWQSPLWAYYVGAGSKRVWGSLPSATQVLVSRMVAQEADRLLLIPPAYYRDASGTILSVGDSKAEENAWNATFLFLAARMYANGDPVKAAAWDAQARWYALTSYATPDQVGTDPRIQGSNLNPDGTINNHGRLHPDYMASQGEMVTAFRVVSAWSKTAFSTECMNRLTRVWTGLTKVKFTKGPLYRAPGGTIYRVNSKKQPTPDIYWPQGTNWATDRKHNFALMDVAVFVAGHNYAYAWAMVHIKYVIKQQSRHKDGSIFSVRETNFPQDEEFAAACAAQMVESLRYVK